MNGLPVGSLTNVFLTETSTLDWLQILHGQKDQRSSPQNSEDLYSSAGSTDKTIKRYPDGQHQLLQDKQDITQTVIKDIVAWLDARTSKA